MENQPAPSLPFRRDLQSIYIISLVVAGLMATASAAGLLCRADIYPTQDLLASFAANDLVNLCIGLPILLVSLWWTRPAQAWKNTITLGESI